jgi:hypothetical protein
VLFRNLAAVAVVVCRRSLETAQIWTERRPGLIFS